MKILFVLKERFYNDMHVKSYGLINSSKQVAKYLESIGYDTKIVTVIDGNGIDREVYIYKPDMVIIEALWVTGKKLKELIEIKRYAHITWVVRIHSNIAYLNAETFALKYINEYIALNKSNLIVAPNNEKLCEYLSNALNYYLEYLPNIIRIKHHHHNNNNDDLNKDSNTINIGCFGALRLLKNQLFQAVCSIKAADRLEKTLFFHVTADGIVNPEKLNPVLKNLEELFANSNHRLVIHSWMENDEFQRLIKKMDLGLQLSFSESFNIVTSDFVNNNVPILVSDAINWMPNIMKVSTIDYDTVTNKIIFLYNYGESHVLLELMRQHLITYNLGAEKIWFDFLSNYSN